MSDLEMIERIAAEIEKRSMECQRGLVGDRTVNGIPIAGYALIAPNCILYCQPLIPERDIFIDFCLN